MSEATAARVIQKCGGPKVVADLIGSQAAAVYRWTYPKHRGGTGGYVPAKHQQTLLAHARANGIDLSPADFFDLPADESDESAAA